MGWRENITKRIRNLEILARRARRHIVRGKRVHGGVRIATSFRDSSTTGGIQEAIDDLPK